ncbi:MAG TPA: oligosaccharide flippase family protein [Gaiellaceae bacterium]|jgi:O-antigen/teichoic acid export membrane protein|nr:oligosaccharide flippase family protein [Gaiellaceae bacterium]
MLSSLAWRRAATAVGIYASALLGFLGTVVAAHLLGLERFGLLAIVLAAAGFFQLLLDLSTDDAIVKFGFRYVERERWGRLRRLLALGVAIKAAGGVLGALAILALVPFAERLFGDDRLTIPLAVSALLPLAQAPQGIAMAAVLVRGRYEVRALLQSFQMLARLVAMAVGASFGVTETVVALVVAQVVSTSVTWGFGWWALSGLPVRASEPEPIAEEAPLVRRFVALATLGTAIDAARGMLAPLLLGVVSTPAQVSYFRAAQAPQYAFSTLSAPVRLILLTEQTRDFERGNLDRVVSSLRRYVLGATLLMAAILAPVLLLMPFLIRLVFPDDFAPAADPARIVLVAAAVQVVFGWSKSFPVSIGRPNLRIVANGVEAAVLVPLLLVLGTRWGATGAAFAVLGSVLAFALAWLVMVLRLRREWLARSAAAAAHT